MKPYNEMSKDDILNKKLLMEVFDNQPDLLDRSETLARIGERARELKCKTDFDKMVKAFERVDKETSEKKHLPAEMPRDHMTNFSDCPYPQMRCGLWIAGDKGVFIENPDKIRDDILACYHPIIPIRRMSNLETKRELIELAYKRNNIWQSVIVPKTMITSNRNIVELSSIGISVTSETSRALVRYLSDVENLNDDNIPIQFSSSKLGWIDGSFLPYDKEIRFDGDLKFNQVFESIHEYGDRDQWYKLMRSLRKTNKPEIKFALASSFASILIKLLGTLPFFVDFWGETEGGKTITLMIAASVWANPNENVYIGDFKTTSVALEAKADMLNNLPMILDDTSKATKKFRDEFESLVYDLSSGKGKSRSNKDIGLNRENHWANCIITSGERPLNSYVNQGGAYNRILEIECSEHIYKKPHDVAEEVKHNYGFAGREFVDLIKEIGIDSIKEIQEGFLEELLNDSTMEKQSSALSVILTADKLATDYLFKDGEYISIEEAKNALIDRNELSDAERAYRYIQDQILMNPKKFDEESQLEQWGFLQNGSVVFYATAFDELLKKGGYSKDSFLSWAMKKNLLDTNEKRRNTKVIRVNGSTRRVYCIRLVDDETDDNVTADPDDGFIAVTEKDSETLPFL